MNQLGEDKEYSIGHSMPFKKMNSHHDYGYCQDFHEPKLNVKNLPTIDGCQEKSTCDNSQLNNGQYYNQEQNYFGMGVLSSQADQQKDEGNIYSGIPQKIIKLNTHQEESSDRQFFIEDEYIQNKSEIIRMYPSENNYLNDYSCPNNNKIKFYTLNQFNSNVQLFLHLEEEDIQKSSIQNAQLEGSEQYNLESCVHKIGKYDIECNAMKKKGTNKQKNKQIVKLQQKMQIPKNSIYWNPEYEKKYQNLWKFLQRESKWKCFSKQSPNILVYLVCNYTANLKIEQWNLIVQDLVFQFDKVTKGWSTCFNLKLSIKLKIDIIKLDQINSKWFAEKKRKKKYDLPSSFYFLKNFKTLCKGIGMEKVFKETESFDEVQKQLNSQLENPNIKQEHKDQIQSLIYLVKMIKYHKDIQITKQTLNFDKTDILELYDKPLIKEQIDYIQQQILISDKPFLDYITVNDIKSQETQNSSTTINDTKTIDNTNNVNIDEKIKKKKTNPDHITSLIAKVKKLYEQSGKG